MKKAIFKKSDTKDIIMIFVIIILSALISFFGLNYLHPVSTDRDSIFVIILFIMLAFVGISFYANYFSNV